MFKQRISKPHVCRLKKKQELNRVEKKKQKLKKEEKIKDYKKVEIIIL